MFTPLATFSGFSVNSLEKAKEFYEQTLGVEVEDTKGMGLKLHLPGGSTLFVYEKENHTPATYTILNFIVANIDEAVDTLSQKGVKFERYEGMPFTQDEKGIARGLKNGMGPDIAWFTDPAGNVLSVLQEK